MKLCRRVVTPGFGWNVSKWDAILPAFNPVAMIEIIEWGNPAAFRLNLLMNLVVHVMLVAVLRRYH